jgi:hypothetical protein
VRTNYKFCALSSVCRIYNENVVQLPHRAYGAGSTPPHALRSAPKGEGSTSGGWNPSSSFQRPKVQNQKTNWPQKMLHGGDGWWAHTRICIPNLLLNLFFHYLYSPDDSPDDDSSQRSQGLWIICLFQIIIQQQVRFAALCFSCGCHCCLQDVFTMSVVSWLVRKHFAER